MSNRLFRAFDAIQDNYVRDPLFEHRAARDVQYRWLAEERVRVAGDMWDDQASEGLAGAAAVSKAIELYAVAEEKVLREMIRQLPKMLLHEMHNAWAYREADVTSAVDPASIDTGPESGRMWRARAAQATVDAPERVGGTYDGSYPIEDVALPPVVRWTEADKKAALDKAVSYFELGPGQWIDMEWPPTSENLYDPGYTYTPDFEPCEAHADAYYDDEDTEQCDECEACQESVRPQVESMAQWIVSTEVRVMEIHFDSEGNEREAEVDADNGFEVMTYEQDPRDVMIGPPHRGEAW